MSRLKFSICIPVFKGSSVLSQALKTILTQSFTNFEVLIGDDNHPQDITEINHTKELIASFKDIRIKYFKTPKNLGYAANLKFITSKAKNDIIFLFAQDDLLSKNALQKTHDAFFLAKDIGAVTRAYFWYHKDVKKAVRAVSPLDKYQNKVINIFDSEQTFNHVMWSVGQLSGLAYRRDYLSMSFGDECFTAHIYPFLDIFKNHQVVFLKDYTVAVSIPTSQTRSISQIYDIPPTESWIKMYQRVLAEKKFQKLRKWGIKHMAKNYIGLVQIKNYASQKYLLREIKLLIKYRWQNLFNLKFWFFSISCLIIPQKALRPLVDLYKEKINSKLIPNIHFEY